MRHPIIEDPYNLLKEYAAGSIIKENKRGGLGDRKNRKGGLRMAEQALEQLKKWVDESENIVFFGGAGVSTESGIPDFRSVDGL